MKKKISDIEVHGSTIVEPLQHTHRTRYSAVPFPGEVLGGTSKTEPDKGISIKDLMDKYQRPPVEPIYDDRFTIPVFPRAMDFAQVQQHADYVEDLRNAAKRKELELIESQKQAEKIAAEAKAAREAAQAASPAAN